MTCKRAVATILLVFALPSAALAQAGTITKGMQNNCANDYKKFCGDYGLQTAALNLCMKKAGPSLVAGLRAGAGAGWKGLASGRGQDQGADERAVAGLSQARPTPRRRPPD